MTEKDNPALNAAIAKPALITIARLVATDRRVVVLATDKAEILLSNAAAGKLELDAAGLLNNFNWRDLCNRARRAGSVAVSATFKSTPQEGELVHLPLGSADGFLLRLAETDQEAAILKNRTRTATLLRVSHDLRTPIQSLLATADALFEDQGSDPAAIDGKRAKMQRAAQLALDHIDNVIKVIRGELTTAELQNDEDFNLYAEVRSTIDMIQPIANARGTTVKLQFDPQDDVHVHGPVRFVRALLQNLFDNSVKYGGKEAEIDLVCKRDTKAPDNNRFLIDVQVADLGGGLPEAQKSRLIQAIGPNPAPSPQHDHSSPETHGTNRASAGLNVLAHALTQLGGQLEIYDRGIDGKIDKDAPSEKVIGTILNVRFALDAATTAKTEKRPEPGTKTEATKILKGLGILVVEDSPSSRDWLVQSLASAGAHVVSAENGLEALKILVQPQAAQDIDLLLSDMTLPYINGVELVRRIKAAQASGKMTWSGKMLGLTAHVDERLRATCLDLGMARLLEKPIRLTELYTAIYEATHDLLEDASDLTNAATDAQSTVTQSATEQVLGKKMVNELIDQLGLNDARGYMVRALAEAQLVHENMVSNGVGHDTWRLIHAATGACGLTGLKLLEQKLRELEASLDASEEDLALKLAEFGKTIEVTTQAIQHLT
ncbi:response regulator [Roseovarius aestuarii]|nr:response regulator [Roseovarius aestuarii]